MKGIKGRDSKPRKKKKSLNVSIVEATSDTWDVQHISNFTSEGGGGYAPDLQG
jgi:hypothetical protein